MLKQDYEPHVSKVFSKPHSCHWSNSPLISVTESSLFCLGHYGRSEGVVNSGAPGNTTQMPVGENNIKEKNGCITSQQCQFGHL